MRPVCAQKRDKKRMRIHKMSVGSMEVGEARSSEEVPIKSGWSEGALAWQS